MVGEMKIHLRETKIGRHFQMFGNFRILGNGSGSDRRYRRVLSWLEESFIGVY